MGQLYEIPTIFDSLEQVWEDNIYHCNYYDFYRAMKKNCKREEMPCEWLTLLTNFALLHAFDSVMAMATLSATMATFTFSIDSDGFFEETNAIGKQFGTITAAVFDYDPFYDPVKAAKAREAAAKQAALDDQTIPEYLV